MLAPWKKSYEQPRQHIKKQRHYSANKGPSSQSYGFSSSHDTTEQLNWTELMYGCEIWTIKKAERQQLMLLNCGVGEDSWESLGQQGDQTSPS